MRGITGERKGRVKSRNMYKGLMNKGNGWGKVKCGKGVRQGRGEQGGGGMRTTVIEQQ